MNLVNLLGMPRETMLSELISLSGGEPATGSKEAPIDPHQEVWAAGVTYLRSRDARREESAVADIYERVYEAERPELFSKSIGWRVSGSGMPIRIRRDSKWNVPEPELVLVINRHHEIVGYCAGNDVSSRDIEVRIRYLPQARSIWLMRSAMAFCCAKPLRSKTSINENPTANETVLTANQTHPLWRTLPELSVPDT
jgi:2-dehydro-3-deoxy-D-arabinonate dehydratase